MMFLRLFTILLLGLLLSCQSMEAPSENAQSPSVETTAVKSDLFYHYSIWYAFVNKIYDGELTVGQAKLKGDIGLGSYDRLAGELIMLDGVAYRATEDGKVSIAQDDDKIVYLNTTFFDSEQSFTIEQADSYENLRSQLNAHLPSKNLFYAFKIHGNFKKMKCGGLREQEPPFTEGLDVLIPNRPIFEREDFRGTMVGFWCPKYIGDINVEAYHLHFVSDDKSFAGHVMEFEAEELAVSIDYISQYQFEVPTSEEFLKGEFDKEFQYNNN